MDALDHFRQMAGQLDPEALAPVATHQTPDAAPTTVWGSPNRPRPERKRTGKHDPRDLTILNDGYDTVINARTGEVVRTNRPDPIPAAQHGFRPRADEGNAGRAARDAAARHRAEFPWLYGA